MATKKDKTASKKNTAAKAGKPSAKAVKKPAADGAVGEAHEKVQLWKDGPYWATTNIGAEKPEDFGYYFWWGDTVGYKRVKNKWMASDGSSSDWWFGYDLWFEDFGPIAPPGEKILSFLADRGWITDADGDAPLVPEHDAAHVHWGGGWRMPTHDELYELEEKCDWTWKKVNGVDGYVVCGKGDYAAASIFLPAAGQASGTSLCNAGSEGGYWASDPGYESWDDSWDLFFCSDRLSIGSGTYRCTGLCVRPVQGFTS